MLGLTRPRCGQRSRYAIEENAKHLHRLDTGERIETKPLSQQDRAKELARVEKLNQEQPKTQTMKAGA